VPIFAEGFEGGLDAFFWNIFAFAIWRYSSRQVVQYIDRYIQHRPELLKQQICRRLAPLMFDIIKVLIRYFCSVVLFDAGGHIFLGKFQRLAACCNIITNPGIPLSCTPFATYWPIGGLSITSGTRGAIPEHLGKGFPSAAQRASV
jgi:hypothetical protein